MKISSKGRYALAAMIILAQNTSGHQSLTVVAISGRLNVSKIYLEQVFALLRRGGLVTSTKGAGGGYQLARTPSDITAADILSVTETSIFEATESTAKDAEPGIERALQDLLFKPANTAFKKIFSKMSLSDLSDEAIKKSAEGGYMYYV
jgi:Rrf2 family protein